jgi:hypothetical protein
MTIPHAGAEHLMDFAEHRRISQSFLTSEFSSPKVLANAAKENSISIAYGTERSSGMDRSDLSNLTAFVAVADRDGVRLIGQVNITGATSVGQRTIVYPFASLGTPPQSVHYRGEPTRLAHCEVREGVTMNRH